MAKTKSKTDNTNNQNDGEDVADYYFPQGPSLAAAGANAAVLVRALERDNPGEGHLEYGTRFVQAIHQVVMAPNFAWLSHEQAIAHVQTQCARQAAMAAATSSIQQRHCHDENKENQQQQQRPSKTPTTPPPPPPTTTSSLPPGLEPIYFAYFLNLQPTKPSYTYYGPDGNVPMSLVTPTAPASPPPSPRKQETGGDEDSNQTSPASKKKKNSKKTKKHSGSVAFGAAKTNHQHLKNKKHGKKKDTIPDVVIQLDPAWSEQEFHQAWKQMVAVMPQPLGD